MLLSYYGDDFTGSTDVMWVLAERGVRTLLFLDVPDVDLLDRFPDVQAVGVAGVARSLPTQEMEPELKPVFRWMKATGARFAHYKMCSTLDSSPEIGSVGLAIELGRRILSEDTGATPVVVAAPMLGRYQAFGNLFARSGLDSPVYRLDRHPTMSRHPVTPMDESDVRLHLARQTGLSIGLVDAVQLDEIAASSEDIQVLAPSGDEIVAFDVLHDGHLVTIGGILASAASARGQLFVVGSSSVEYALTRYWERTGAPYVGPSLLGQLRPVERLLVASGSCSPVTANQIEWALQHGFVEVPLSTDLLLDAQAGEEACRDAVRKAVTALKDGRSVIVHSCKGPDDPRVAHTRNALKERSGEAVRRGAQIAQRIGDALGRIVQSVQAIEPVQRVIVTGGDNSGYVARSLGIDALEAAAPLAPGSPLCRIHSSNALDGLEIAFKGGQVGTRAFFGHAAGMRV